MDQLEQLFLNGNMLSCYKAVTKEQHHRDREKYLQLFHQHQFQEIPSFDKSTLTQSVERENEKYDEDDEVERIRQIVDEQQFKQEIQQLEQIAQNGSQLEKAQSFYSQGHLFLYAHHYNEAVHCFKQAVKQAPEKGVYAGMLAQTLQRLNYSPIEALGYIELALTVDNKNARWYLVKALLLLQLYKDLGNDAFFNSAIFELSCANDNCRDEQVSLRTAIDSTEREIAEILH